MDNGKLIGWLKRYESLGKKSDRLWEEAQEHEAVGDHSEAVKATRRMKEIDERRQGMLEALNIFGYTAVCQDGEYKVAKW